MGWTTKIMHRRWKFDQNLRKNELEFIWKDFDSRSWRSKSHSILRCISWDLGENRLLQSMVKKCVSWNSMKEFFFEVMERMFYIWETSEKFKFSYLEKFFLTQQLRWNGKYWKLELNPLLSWKSQVKLSLLSSSHSLQS